MIDVEGFEAALLMMGFAQDKEFIGEWRRSGRDGVVMVYMDEESIRMFGNSPYTNNRHHTFTDEEEALSKAHELVEKFTC
jgi:hypothetical protein